MILQAEKKQDERLHGSHISKGEDKSKIEGLKYEVSTIKLSTVKCCEVRNYTVSRTVLGTDDRTDRRALRLRTS